MTFFGEWLVYALLALVCWGMVNVIDTFLVEEDIYNNPSEGMIVSSLFKIVGAIIFGGIFFKEALSVNGTDILLAMAGGALLSVAFYFYFKAAFLYNDLSLVQIFWSLAIPLISFLGWMTLGEKLSFYSYLGIGVILLGNVCISFSRGSLDVDLGKFFLINIPLVIFYSLSQVLMKYVGEIKGVDFWGSFPYVCLGQVVFGVALLVFNYKAVREDKLLARIASKNWKIFVSSEAIELGGVFFMMLSIAKTPAITYHAVTEAFMPLVVIAMTGIAGLIMKMMGKSESLSEVYQENHTAGLGVKVLATALMAVGVYLMG